MTSRIFSMNLKTRVAAAVLLLFLATIWVLTFLTTTRLQTDLVRLLEDQQFSHVSHVAAEVEQKIEARFSSLEVVANEITPAMLANPARLKSLLQNRPLLFSFFEPGVVVVSHEGFGLVDHPSAPFREGSSFSELEYFQGVMATGARTLGKPRVGRYTNKLSVAFAVPIRNPAGQTVAVLVGYAHLGDAGLFGIVQNSTVGKTGWIAISDARHRVIIAINDPKRVMQEFPRPGVNLMLDQFAAGYEGSGVSTNSQGRQVLTSARQIGATGWFVQAVLPTVEAFEPIRALESRAYIIAAWLSAMVTIISWMLIWWLLGPLSVASDDIRKMANAESDLHELPIDHHDEIGELLTSFNTLFKQRQHLEAELERQARTDSLTGLANRRLFLETADQELARTVRFGGELSVLMLDLDHFKKINDTYGHKVGDLVLKKFAEISLGIMREIDLVARYGGEEFAILLPGTGLADAREAAERLRLRLAEAKVPLEQGLPVAFSVSIGVASLSGQVANIDTLINQADQALYEAKNSGRNRVSVYRAS